jgi:hypothetical protein
MSVLRGIDFASSFDLAIEFWNCSIMWCVFCVSLDYIKLYKHLNTKIKLLYLHDKLYILISCFKAFLSIARICSEVNQYISPNVRIKYPCWSGAATVSVIKYTMRL